MDEQDVAVEQATISLEEAQAELSESPTGAMPPHRRVLLLGEVASVLMGQSPPGETYNQAQIGKPLINGPAEYGPEHPAPVQWTTKPERVCKAGDILFCVRGNTTGRMNIADQDYCIGRGVAAIHGTDGVTETGFLKYFLEYRRPLIYRIAAAGGSTFPNFSGAQLKGMAIPLPPLTEQRAIAHILRTVQEAIQARRREADLERERKAALMQHLFTYGTRGEPTKQTEIGEMSESWQVVQLRNICTIVRGSSPRPKGDPRYYGGNVPRLMIADVTRDGMYVTPQIDFLTESGAALSRPMKKGDLILSISGTVGLPCFLAIDACIHDGFIGLKNITRKMVREYLYFQILFWRERLNVIAPMGSIFKNLTTDIVKDFPICLPSLDEQHEIAGTMLACEAKLAAVQQEAALLEELFRALLEELMTGRLSVAPLVEVEVAQ